MDGYDAGTYGRAFADVYDDWYGDVSDVDATVAGVHALAGGGRVLELGVGTGRLALPLAATGLDVVGVDASQEMLDRLRAKPGADAVRAVLGDMADLAPLDLGPPFAVAFAAFNTFFNLTTRDAQRSCLRGVAARLVDGGALAIEAFVPPEPDTADSVVTPRTIEHDRVVLTVARRDPASQTITGQHVEFTERGGIRLRPWLVRYAAPRELDDLAAEAGFTLERRSADWRGTPFDGASTTHVSVYRTGAR